MQLKAEFTEELSEIQAEFMTERARIVEQYEREINEIKDIQFAMTVSWLVVFFLSPCPRRH